MVAGFEDRFVIIYIRSEVYIVFRVLFSYFAVKLRTQKLNKTQIKQLKITSVQYLRTYQQVVSSFNPYHLSSFFLLPHNLIQLPFVSLSPP